MIIKNDNVINLKDNKTKRMSDAMDADINGTVSLDVFSEAIKTALRYDRGIMLLAIPDVGDVVILDDAVNILMRLFSTPFFERNYKELFVYISTIGTYFYPSFNIIMNKIKYGRLDNESVVTVYQSDDNSCRWRLDIMASKKNVREIKDFMGPSNYFGSF